MEEYNKIIESLGVRFIRAKHLDIVQPVRVVNFYDIENTLLLLDKGHLYYGEDNIEVKEGELLFIPAGKPAIITYGHPSVAVTVSNEEFLNNRDKYFRRHAPHSENGAITENYHYVTFEAKVFDSVGFFTSLDIPSFTIAPHRKLTALMNEVAKESEGSLAGRDRIIHLNTDQIVVEIFRYIVQNKLFVEQLATNTTYFKDPRLIDIFTHIKNSLSGDLSNKVLAEVANVSEDYVGQYFKMLTGINPQDYIEYQRMEMAVNLLRTSKKSIRAIGEDVGYKDTAYFCRRFKMMFGIPAGKMRRRESLINV
jgi:AraC family transcriptional regulator, activator of mtrCDE